VKTVGIIAFSVVVSVVLVLGVLFAVGTYEQFEHEKKVEEYESNLIEYQRQLDAEIKLAQEKEESETSEKTEFKILFGGDFSFGESFQDRLKEKGEESTLEKYGYDYSLTNFKQILLSSDYVVLNLETVLTDLSTSELEGEKFSIIYSDPKNTAYYLKKYNVDAVSLANNHAFDFGKDGLYQTIEVLEKNELEWFGAGRNGSEASFPLFKTFKLGDEKFNLAVFGAFEFHKRFDQNHNFYANEIKAGVNMLDMDRIVSQIQYIKTLDPKIFVVVYPHWGQSFSWKTDKQTEIGHKLIDSGADLILGHGPHLIQEVEYYNGKWIVYSLGNFMFNSPGLYYDSDEENHLTIPPAYLYHDEENHHSVIAVFSITENNKVFSMNLKLYPIFSNNEITNYQPRFLLEDEFDLTTKKLFEVNSKQNDELMTIGQDDIGHYVELSISNSGPKK